MDNSTPIQLGRFIGNLCRLQANRADHFTEQIGLYRGQAILLLFLSHQDGQTHSALAEKLEISPAATTKVIKRLEELNYLQRQPDPADERISRVFLKKDGWAVIQRIRQAFDRIDRALVKDMTIAEQQVLRDLLSRVYENLQSMPLEPPF